MKNGSPVPVNNKENISDFPEAINQTGRPTTTTNNRSLLFEPNEQRKMCKFRWIVVVLALMCAFVVDVTHGKSDPGKTETTLDRGSNTAKEMRPLLANSAIYVKIDCDTKEPSLNISIYWSLTERECWYDDTAMQNMYNAYADQLQLQQNHSSTFVSPRIEMPCPNHLFILPSFDDNTASIAAVAAPAGSTLAAALKAGGVTTPTSEAAKSVMDKMGTSKGLQQNPVKPPQPFASNNKPIFVVKEDGIYEFKLTIDPLKAVDFTAPVHIEILGPHGYISATDWPLLPFYCIMCIVYVVYGIIWLVVSFMQWRDLLRIQFWIGGVILLGMLEKAFFYAQYNSLNHNGVPVQGAELAAEFVSCAKRTLARMLVIIMSLGFGIVKPRLGPMLHRVVGVGALYFVLACVESYLRVMRTKADEHNQLLVASIPLAVLDTGICWWIFTSLMQTTRTLRLRRNMVKLSLYKHFTNTLIFSVIASVIFMLYALRLRKTENCTPGWHDIWMDTAFWHVLFSVLLVVIMILWRPTNNNQRYAFTPLLDNPEDEDEEEEDQFVADAYGVKMRGTHTNGARTPPASRATTTEEDDLRWVEENIPSSMAEPALPVLDSDEEIINTKFEVSKMQ